VQYGQNADNFPYLARILLNSSYGDCFVLPPIRTERTSVYSSEEFQNRLVCLNNSTPDHKSTESSTTTNTNTG